MPAFQRTQNQTAEGEKRKQVEKRHSHRDDLRSSFLPDQPQEQQLEHDGDGKENPADSRASQRSL